MSQPERILVVEIKTADNPDLDTSQWKRNYMTAIQYL